MNKTSLVDRLGASQGMAEIISALEKGTEESVMAQAIEIASDPTNDPSMRDGYISLFKYLPTTMQQESFIPYIEKVIPPILLALGDETEYLRNSALHTGQILISTYASQAKRCLLPSLLESVIDENWRIRSAAVTLIGDFLFNITGLSSKMTSDTQNEDDTMALQNADKTILKYVGQKSRDRIIVSLYLARFDAVSDLVAFVSFKHPFRVFKSDKALRISGSWWCLTPPEPSKTFFLNCLIWLFIAFQPRQMTAELWPSIVCPRS